MTLNTERRVAVRGPERGDRRHQPRVSFGLGNAKPIMSWSPVGCCVLSPGRCVAGRILQGAAAGQAQSYITLVFGEFCPQQQSAFTRPVKPE